MAIPSVQMGRNPGPTLNVDQTSGFSEIARRQRAERELQLLITLMREVPAAPDFLSAVGIALNRICEATGWAFGDVWIPNADRTALEHRHSWFERSEELNRFDDLSQGFVFPPGVGIAGRAWAGKRSEWLKDISTSKNPRAQIALAAGLRSTLAVPIVADEEVLCVLVFLMREARDEDRQLVELASAVAAQLAAMLKQKWLEQELTKARTDLESRVQARARDLARSNRALQAEVTERRRMQDAINAHARQQAAVAQIGRLALAGGDLTDLFGQSCALVAQTLGVELCKVLELLPDGESLRLRSGVGWRNGLLGHAIVSSGFNSQAGYTLLSGGPVVVEDLRAETRFQGPPLLHDHGVVSGMSVLIPGRERSFGVLGAHTTKRRVFAFEDVNFLEAVANVFCEAIERKQAEEEIQRGGAWLRSLIETTQDAVISIDRHGGVVLFNPAAERIFGYTREEIVGQKVNVLMAEPYQSEHDGYIERYERTGVPHAIGRIRSVTAKRKSGELFPIELSVTKVAEDKDVQYAAFIRDISEKTRLQAQLVENERLAAIGTTAAKIGHELGNPLNGMSLTIQLLESRLSRESGGPAGDVSTTIKRLKNEIARLNHLTEEFRTISRREKYDFQPTQLSILVDDVINVLAPLLDQQRIEVRASIDPDLPKLNLDRDKIKQALLNLIKNAIEAMPGGGRLIIDATRAPTSVRLEITDSGMGIPLDVDAFEPFMTTKKDGTGLGLMIVRQIIMGHGGSVSYRSRIGEGTTFQIELPLNSD